MDREISEYVSELRKALNSGRTLLDWTNQNITGVRAIKIFTAIQDDEVIAGPDVSVKGAITIDLGENRMGDMDIDALKAVLAVVKNMHWMLVRFGYDIVAPRLKEAMHELEMDHEWDVRVQLDQPWRHPSNVRIDQTLQELKANSVDLKRILEELKQINAGNHQQMLGYVKSNADAFEHEAALGIARFLTDGEVVQASYEWKSKEKHMPGDVDCIVTGVYGDEQVVVIGEAKHNMCNDYNRAVSQLRWNYVRWTRLCSLQQPPPPGSSSAMDYHALRIDQLRTRRVMLAFAGNLFPPSTDDDINTEISGYVALQHLLPIEWIKVVPDSGAVSLVC